MFLWKKSYEIKIPEIDMQHRQLVGLVNELSDAMMAKQGHRTVPHILAELLDYVMIHFTTEEEAMQKMRYPGLTEHKEMHLDLTKQVLDYKNRYIRNDVMNSGELLTFLCDWLKTHIIVHDKNFGNFARRVEMGIE